MGLIARLGGNPALRFLLAGGFASAVNWLARFPFSAVLPYSGAIVAAQVVGWAVGFVLYRSFVFAPSGRNLRQELSLFLLVNLASLLGVVAVAVAGARLMEIGGLDTFTAEAAGHAAGIAAGAVLNFLGHRAFTFAGHTGNTQAAEH